MKVGLWASPREQKPAFCRRCCVAVGLPFDKLRTSHPTAGQLVGQPANLPARGVDLALEDGPGLGMCLDPARSADVRFERIIGPSPARLGLNPQAN